MTIPADVSCTGFSFYRIYSLSASLFHPIRIPFESEMHLNIAIPSVLIGTCSEYLWPSHFIQKESHVVPKRVTNPWVRSTRLVITSSISMRYICLLPNVSFSISFHRPVAWFDRHIVDGTMNRIGWLISISSEKIKGFQSGQLQQYALVFVSGVVILALIVLYNLS